MWKKLNTQLIVQVLSQKYKTAQLALDIVVPAFQGFTRFVGDPSWIKEWEKLEACHRYDFLVTFLERTYIFRTFFNFSFWD